MSADSLPLRCVCGALQGALAAVAEPRTRGRCYCYDCRAYGVWLGRDDVLDAHGGTEVVQTWPSRVRLTAGVEQVRLMKLSPKGLHRWFAGCCRTPIANGFGPGRAPFLGLQARFVAPDARPRLDELFGAAHGVQGRFAPGGCPPGVHASASAGILWAATGMLVRGLWAGGHAPHPLFSPDGTPIATAEVLTAEARAALE